MNSFITLCRGELLKLKRSWVPRICALGFMLGPVFAFVFMLVIQNPEMAKNLAAQGGKFNLEKMHADWPTFLSIVVQSFAVGGGVVYGFLTSYVFGREHAEGNFLELLALRHKRFTIFLAKYAVSVLVCLVISVVVLGASLLLGLISGIGGFSGELLATTLGSIGASTGIHLVLASAVAMAAFVLRGYLPAIGFVIVTMVLSQIFGAIGLGTYFPWTIPALTIGLAGPLQVPNALSYVLVGLVCMASLLITRSWLKRADHV